MKLLMNVKRWICLLYQVLAKAVSWHIQISSYMKRVVLYTAILVEEWSIMLQKWYYGKIQTSSASYLLVGEYITWFLFSLFFSCIDSLGDMVNGDRRLCSNLAPPLPPKIDFMCMWDRLFRVQDTSC